MILNPGMNTSNPTFLAPGERNSGLIPWDNSSPQMGGGFRPPPSPWGNNYGSPQMGGGKSGAGSGYMAQPQKGQGPFLQGQGPFLNGMPQDSGITGPGDIIN